MKNIHGAHSDKVPRISVAMAAYNGEKYISAQLESLAQQDLLPFELVICDDVSTDSTHEIIEKFRQTAPFPVHFIKNETNLGHTNNFLKAAGICKGDWVSFCDQDDVWLPNKLSSAAVAIQENENAILILQNAIMSDSELKARGRLYPNDVKAGVYGPWQQHGYWCWSGFLQTVLADVVRDLKPSERPVFYENGERYSHDYWISMIGNAIGDIVILSEPVALYRRHPAALSGYHRRKSFKERISNSFKYSSSYYASRSRIALASARYLRDISADCQRKIWQDHLNIAAEKFDNIALIHDLRAKIYSEYNILLRIKCFIKIFLARGYFGPPMIATGSRSVVKDFSAVLGIFGQIASKQGRESSSGPV